MENKIYDIWFSRVEISNNTKLKLLKKYSSLQIWKLSKKELEEEKLQAKTIHKILDSKYRYKLEKYYEYMEKNNIVIIDFKDNAYPTNLNNIIDKPSFIYVRGNIENLYGDSVAIVGSRNATEYGKLISRKIAKELSDKNINIISGLARGIDKYSHLGSLDSNIGKTIAVLRYWFS